MFAGWFRTRAALCRAALLATASCIALGGAFAAAQQPDFAKPQRHFRVARPASLDPHEALIVYDRIADDMVAGYAMSRDRAAITYRGWRRYNKAPYRSATHGERFVNNYANPIAKDYGHLDGLEEMPVGSIIAKDSFAVTATGDVFTGPLFLMEKMPDGFHPASRDWRYTMILPDGSYFGTTRGANAARVEFCITCHATAGDDNDHLFFVPEDHQLTVYRLDELTD